MNLWKRIFSCRPAIDYLDMIRRGAVLIDVRSVSEFSAGHIDGSVNIPLDQINNNIPALRKKAKPLITICRSGARSASARAILASAGLEVYNGGGWESFQAKISKG